MRARRMETELNTLTHRPGVSVKILKGVKKNREARPKTVQRKTRSHAGRRATMAAIVGGQ